MADVENKKDVNVNTNDENTKNVNVLKPEMTQDEKKPGFFAKCWNFTKDHVGALIGVVVGVGMTLAAQTVIAMVGGDDESDEQEALPEGDETTEEE